MSLIMVLLKYRGQSSPRMERITAQLQTADGGWWTHSDDCWIIKDSRSTGYWAETIRNLMIDQDTVLVSKVQLQELRGWAPQPVWGWLEANGIVTRSR